MAFSLISSSYACTSCLMSIRDWYKKCTLVNYLKEKKSQARIACGSEYMDSCKAFERQLSTGEYFKTNYILIVCVFLAYLLNISTRIGLIFLQGRLVFAFPIHFAWHCVILLVVNLIRFGFVREDKKSNVLFNDPFHRYHTLFFYYPLIFSNQLTTDKMKGKHARRGLLVCAQFVVDLCLTLMFLLINYQIFKSIQSSILVVYMIDTFFFFILFFISICIQVCIRDSGSEAGD